MEGRARCGDLLADAAGDQPAAPSGVGRRPGCETGPGPGAAWTTASAPPCDHQPAPGGRRPSAAWRRRPTGRRSGHSYSCPDGQQPHPGAELGLHVPAPARRRRPAAGPASAPSRWHPRSLPWPRNRPFLSLIPAKEPWQACLIPDHRGRSRLFRATPRQGSDRPGPRYKARPQAQPAGGSGARPIRPSERYGSQPQRLPQLFNSGGSRSRLTAAIGDLHNCGCRSCLPGRREQPGRFGPTMTASFGPASYRA